ncbi:hypothetical protein GUITHDRAFT_101288 [Guillardia theta CCMP2712]|uniref:RING-type domain-containing protein n=1 Tax=Guillardia theta (strain CCMP2712) TaxID=905079 RepID=L1JWW4_GUITC|nr:hypothetical protein GUITHDRAFT_101288 [Guillardia theta CCMP2712]EKX52837.1 hypothetical protein GUITHDRAFT_101288 [Guillardia theta CCMP2712]|eukprot:XP_005839817.1 hypothetical protein GUITHDRAFT_101288 [Guillardia theta CCMP2712]
MSEVSFQRLLHAVQAVNNIHLQSLNNDTSSSSAAVSVSSLDLCSLASPDPAASQALPVASHVHDKSLDCSPLDTSGGLTGSQGLLDAQKLVEESKALLVPGALLRGDINIPGMSSAAAANGLTEDGSRAPYELEVVKIEIDELGHQVLVGRHAAYGDEQLCELSVQQEGDQVRLEYADAETLCSGTFDFSNRKIVGTVRQLLQGMDNFFVTSEEISHTFCLHFPSDTPQSAKLRVDMKRARQERMKALTGFVEQWKGTIPSRYKDEMHQMGLVAEEFLTDAVDYAEEICAMMRRQAAILQRLTFDSKKERRKTLESLAEKVYELSTALPDSQISMNVLWSQMIKVQHRLEFSFARLEQALTNASIRVTRETVQTICKKNVEHAPGEEACCMICLVELDDRSTDFQLPCNHVFHEECLLKWLHTHNTCPNCRCVLENEEDVDVKSVQEVSSAESVDESNLDQDTLSCAMK